MSHGFIEMRGTHRWVQAEEGISGLDAQLVLPGTDFDFQLTHIRWRIFGIEFHRLLTITHIQAKA